MIKIGINGFERRIPASTVWPRVARIYKKKIDPRLGIRRQEQRNSTSILSYVSRASIPLVVTSYLTNSEFKYSFRHVWTAKGLEVELFHGDSLRVPSSLRTFWIIFYRCSLVGSNWVALSNISFASCLLPSFKETRPSPT